MATDSKLSVSKLSQEMKITGVNASLVPSYIMKELIFRVCRLMKTQLTRLKMIGNLHTRLYVEDGPAHRNLHFVLYVIETARALLTVNSIV